MDKLALTTTVIAGVFEHRSSIENPNLPLTDPRVWEEVFGESLVADTGDTMNAEKAFRIPAVWQAVSLISGDIAKLPLKMYEQGASGVRREVEDHSLAILLQEQCNEDENAYKFWRRVMVHALIWNNAYVYAPFNRSNGLVEGLYHLLPDRTMLKHIDGKLWCVTEAGGDKQYISADEVIHIEGVSWDGVEGGDLVHAARNSWALAIAQEKFSSKFFKHGGRVGGILELPASMGKTAKDTTEEGFRKSYEGSDNPFKTIVLRDAAKFHAAQTSPKDSQLVEATEQQVRQIARWFNLSPSKLGLSDSVSYSSKSEDNQNYLDTTLSHWLKAISLECSIKLLSASQRRKYWFEHDPSELLRMNPLQRAEYYNSLIASRVINPNEARRTENMEPYDGGDKYENPNTSAPVAADLASDDTTPTSDELPEGDRSAALAKARVVFHVGSNARHKARKPSALLEWLDGGLVTHRQECQELGIADGFIDSIIADMRSVVDRATAEELRGEIDRLTTIHERAVI